MRHLISQKKRIGNIEIKWAISMYEKSEMNRKVNFRKMVSKAKKSVVIYSILLLSSVLTGNAQLAAQTSQGFTNTQFGNQFTNTQGFANTQFGNQFTNTQGFANGQLGNAGFYPNTYAQPTVAPYNAGFHAAKGYATQMYTGNFYNNYAHPVNAQYWTGHSLPAGYQKYPQSYGYSQYGQPNYYGYQSWNYPQQYGYMGVHPAYSGQYLHYPNFNANYWTGHHQMYPIHGVPVYPQHYPYGHYGMQYPYSHGPFYPRPRGFLDGIARSKVAKGLLGALVVGVVAKKIARGK